MRYKTTESLILIEIDEMSLEFLEELHEFLRYSNFSPLRKVEVKNIEKEKPSTGHFSACFTVNQANIVMEWIKAKGVIAHAA